MLQDALHMSYICTTNKKTGIYIKGKSLCAQNFSANFGVCSVIVHVDQIVKLVKKKLVI